MLGTAEKGRWTLKLRHLFAGQEEQVGTLHVAATASCTLKGSSMLHVHSLLHVCYSTCSACSSDMLCRWLSSAFTQGHQQSLADWDHDHQGAPIECLAICQSGAWAKTGVVASGSCNGVVLLTSLADGALLSVRSENRHDEAVTALAFNHDGSFLVSCSRSHVMYLWAVAGASSRPECLKFLHEFWNPQDTSVVTACTLCPDTESSWKHLAISGSQVG